MLDDVGSGAVQYLAGFTDVTSLLGSFAVSDPNYPSFAGKPFLFKDDLLTRIEGTGAIALVCSAAGASQNTLPLTTPRFERLSVEVYADPSRDSSNNVTETQGVTRQRAMALFAAVNFRLQRTDPDVVLWGNLRTVGCELLTVPQFYEMPDSGPTGGIGRSDGTQRGQAYYAVSVFGATTAHI